MISVRNDKHMLVTFSNRFVCLPEIGKRHDLCKNYKHMFVTLNSRFVSLPVIGRIHDLCKK
jgi:hypothetical protein